MWQLHIAVFFFFPSQAAVQDVLCMLCMLCMYDMQHVLNAKWGHLIL